MPIFRKINAMLIARTTSKRYIGSTGFCGSP